MKMSAHLEGLMLFFQFSLFSYFLILLKKFNWRFKDFPNENVV